jgi:glycolate oxidase FAD binding subunit
MHPALRQTIDQVRAAAAARTPLRLRGGGTKDFHGPRGPAGLQGSLLDTRALAGIVSYEPSELVVTAWAGTPLAQLEAALAERRQCLPFEPPHFAAPDAGAAATVGGMVAAGLSGPARVSVGAVRDYVLGLHLVNGRGEALCFGGQVMKNVAGYDVSRLMVGAWGTLGLITQVSLKVLPVAPAEATLRFACTQAEALQRVLDGARQPLPLNASSWVAVGSNGDSDAGGDGNGARRGDMQQPGCLHVRLRGAAAAVEEACRTLGGERLDAQEAAAHWQACREQTLPWFATRAPTHALWRLSLPATAPVLALPATASAPLLEWHGALRWVQAPLADAAALAEAARAVGGSASIFRAHDAGGYLQKDLFGLQSPALQKIQARVRAAFDPAGIFNPGRMGLDG